jgi:hypothetical protein
MGPSDQGWLYRSSDLVLGPVPAKALVDQLYAGELGATTEVSLMGSGVFRRMSDVDEFKVHVAKALAKQRVDQQAAAHHASNRKKLSIALGVGAGVLAVTAVVVSMLGSHLAVHSSDNLKAEEVAFADISIDAPSISRARKTADDDYVDYQGSGRKPGPNGVGTGTRPPGPARPVGEKPKLGGDPDGLGVAEVDQEMINGVVRQFKNTLVPCLQQVAKPGMVEKIPIEFSVAETGKVTRVWVDNPTFKEGPLPECLLKELQKWPFKAGPAGASVNLSFNIGKRG